MFKTVNPTKPHGNPKSGFFFFCKEQFIINIKINTHTLASHLPIGCLTRRETRRVKSRLVTSQPRKAVLGWFLQQQEYDITTTTADLISRVDRCQALDYGRLMIVIFC
ncbi:hypothetical protein PNOK_0699700 [Pyrrhoderma noxium]|uniref:Uncharacterized protein n=1 Tax=Pyrrhoderma noxium TaxID=2282107 RepID=A0A286UBH5_9AGAM|nr:hypothetical protein PNOK_0699700 [Pyrrhoderma noxium]